MWLDELKEILHFFLLITVVGGSLIFLIVGFAYYALP